VFAHAFFPDTWVRDFRIGLGELMGFGFLQGRESDYCGRDLARVKGKRREGPVKGECAEGDYHRPWEAGGAVDCCEDGDGGVEEGWTWCSRMEGAIEARSVEWWPEQ